MLGFHSKKVMSQLRESSESVRSKIPVGGIAIAAVPVYIGNPEFDEFYPSHANLPIKKSSNVARLQGNQICY